MHIKIAYLLSDKQDIIQLEVKNNISVIEVFDIIRQNNYLPHLDLSDLSKLKVGVFGKMINMFQYQIHEYDRIEIYRPLTLNPNQLRLARQKISST